MHPADTPDTYKIKRANEWIAGSRKRKGPKMLFGEFWLEGELSILFADTGMGKSVLAVQIADSIARGVPIKPLRLTAKPQKVAYFDYELDEKQFEMRYSADASDDQDFLHRPYRFSNKFYRAEIDIEADPSPDFATTEAYLRSGLRRGIEKTGAKVVIIDNITYLRGPTDTARTCIPLMREFRRLKKELGLSILLLAHTPKRDTARRITVNDLQGSKVMSNFADNIFAIGQSGIDTGIRYIKHIKQRSTTLLYDASYVPAFEICKRNGNFLEFRFRAFGEEDRHLSSSMRSIRMERAEVVAAMSDEGMSQRAIASELGISAASVNRYLHMAKSNTGDVEEEAYNEDFYEPGDENEEPEEPPKVTEADLDRILAENLEARRQTNAYMRSIGLRESSYDDIYADIEKRRRLLSEPGAVATGPIANPQSKIANQRVGEVEMPPDYLDDEDEDPMARYGLKGFDAGITDFDDDAEDGEFDKDDEPDRSEPGTVVTGSPYELNELNEPNKLSELGKLKYKTMDDRIEVGDIVLDRNGQLKKRTIYGWDLCADALE